MAVEVSNPSKKDLSEALKKELLEAQTQVVQHRSGIGEENGPNKAILEASWSMSVRASQAGQLIQRYRVSDRLIKREAKRLLAGVLADVLFLAWHADIDIPDLLEEVTK